MMGWAVGYLGGRWVGYGVPSKCDLPGCEMGDIDRGLAYACAGEHGWHEYGCGNYFHEDHLVSVAFDPETGERVRDNDPRWDAEDFDQAILEWHSICPACAAGEPPYDPTPDTDEWIVHQLVDESWATWRSDNALQVDRLITEHAGAILAALRVDRARAEKAEEERDELWLAANPSPLRQKHIDANRAEPL